MLNNKPAKKVATAQPSEPHIRALPNSNWLWRDALGVGFQHADTAVEGQSDINPAEDAAE